MFCILIIRGNRRLKRLSQQIEATILRQRHDRNKSTTPNQSYGGDNKA
jgi:hypothetical protein